MKAILYAGAALMAGACIYGFIDYESSSHRKEVKSSYQAPSLPAPKSPAVTETRQARPEAVQESVANQRPAGSKKRLSYKLFSRAPLIDSVVEKELKVNESKHK